MDLVRLTRRLTLGLLVVIAGAHLVHAQNTVSVTVTAPDTIQLPEGAQLDVQLLDTSLMDVAAVPISTQRVAVSQLPITVPLPFDPGVIDPRYTYSVSASLYDGRKLIMRTTSAYPVLTGENGTSIAVGLEKMP
jgi:putative lipoprotein